MSIQKYICILNISINNEWMKLLNTDLYDIVYFHYKLPSNLWYVHLIEHCTEGVLGKNEYTKWE